MTITRERLRKRIRGKNNVTLRKRRKSKGRKRRSFRKNRHVNLRTSSLKGGKKKRRKRIKRKNQQKKRNPCSDKIKELVKTHNLE